MLHVSILMSWYNSQAQSVVLGMNTTTYVRLLVLPSDGEVTVTLVTECDGEGSALVTV